MPLALAALTILAAIFVAWFTLRREVRELRRTIRFALPQTQREDAPPVHWATMRRDEFGGWTGDGKFVREGSESWKSAFDEPGRAVKSPSGKIVEGKQ